MSSSNVLVALSDLVDLNIHANHIDDISVLAGLTGLQDLDLHTNRIFGLAPLSDLATLIVDDNGPGDPGPESAAISDPNENGARDHPFDSIQEAIEVVSPDATIQVRSGTYYESINFMEKNIHVTRD